MMISMNITRNWKCSQLVLGAKAHVHSSLVTYGRATQHIAPKIKTRCLSTTTPPTSKNAKPGRLKREDFRHTYFDSAFSKWKTLSGPFDWEDYSKGNEGAKRYRTQNLPERAAGLYEFGIRCKYSSRVIVVYVGQSQNLRTRLPQYGRNGAHLENRLFSDIFSKGHTIVYRCATMNSKRDAKEIEDELLGTFDYAWNKIRNGDRRPDDIHKKLESRSGRFSCLVNMILRYFDQTRSRDPFIPKNIQGDSATGRLGCKGVLSRIFGTRKQRPREIGRGGHSNEKYWTSNICDKPPVYGRKQCGVHEGMILVPKFETEEKACKPSYNNLLGYISKWFS